MDNTPKDATDKRRELHEQAKLLTESMMESLGQNQPALNSFLLLLSLFEENCWDGSTVSMIAAYAIDIAYGETFHSGDSCKDFIRSLREPETKGGIH
jgi:hypothetical protein